jgi:hypothetical protein
MAGKDNIPKVFSFITNRVDGIIQKVIFKDVEKKDKTKLSNVIDKYGKWSDEWWMLNTEWIEKYRYPLRVQLIFDFIETLTIPSGIG